MVEPSYKGALAMLVREIIAEFTGLGGTDHRGVEVELVLLFGLFTGEIMTEGAPSAFVC